LTFKEIEAVKPLQYVSSLDKRLGSGCGAIG